MIDSTELRTNKTIPEAIYKQIDREIYDTAADIAFARQLIFPRNANAGLTQQAIETLTTDALDASITMTIEGIEKDTVNVSTDTVRIPIIGEHFTIGARNVGANIDAAAASAAAIAVMNKEDELIFGGSSKYGVTGIVAGAGNTESTALDFGTAGNARKKVAYAIGVAQENGMNGINDWNLVLSKTQYDQLLGNMVNNTPEIDLVQRLLGRGNIYRAGTSLLADGTGLLMPAKTRGLVEIYIAVDLTKDLKVDRFGGIDGYVYEAVTPRIINSNALVKLTNI